MKAKNKAEYIEAWKSHLSELSSLALWFTPEQFKVYQEARNALNASIEEAATNQYDCWQCKHCRRYNSLKLDRCVECQSKRGQDQ